MINYQSVWSDLETPASRLISTSLIPTPESISVIFSSDNEMKSNMNKWLKIQSKDFNAEGIPKLLFQWGKCILNNGEYKKKK